MKLNPVTYRVPPKVRYAYTAYDTTGRLWDVTVLEPAPIKRAATYMGHDGTAHRDRIGSAQFTPEPSPMIEFCEQVLGAADKRRRDRRRAALAAIL